MNSIDNLVFFAFFRNIVHKKTFNISNLLVSVFFVLDLLPSPAVHP